MKSGQEARSILKQAEDLMQRALKIKPGEAYNLACMAALRGDESACEYYLDLTQSADNLPDKSHLLKDQDLDSVRSQDWFKRFLEQ